MAEPTPAEKAESWKETGEGLAAGATGYLARLNWGPSTAALVADVFGRVLAFLYKLISPIGIGLAKGIAESEDLVAPELSEIAAAAASDMFGTDVPASAFKSKRDRTGRTRAADALGKGILDQIRGESTTMAPTEAGAQRYLGMVLNMSLEGWYQGWFFEFMSSLVPYFDVGKIESFAELDDILSQTLGLGRLSRRVLGPLVDVTCVTPLEWAVNKAYRPNLLAAGEVARQVARGRWPLERGKEELARQGWDDERIEALFNGQRKFLSVADVNQLYTRGVLTGEQARQHLRDQGYDDDTALLAERVEGTRRFETHENSEGAAIVSAFASFGLSLSEFRSLLGQYVTVPAERALFEELGTLRRQLAQKPLSPSEAKACVKAGILSVRDYRRALELDGYDVDAVLALELLLRDELEADAERDQKRAAADLRRQQLEAERALEKKAREAAADDKRALARRGDEADLEAAAVRGAIPFARVEEVYRARYDDDTIGILVEALEARRQDYIATQKQREDARQRAAARGLSVADLEAAVLEHILSVDEYRTRLAQLGTDAGDVDVLARTLAARLKQRETAEADRERARAAAANRPLSLDVFEQLVRRGRRTLTQYADFVASLGFNAAAVAGLRELLEATIADDTRARQSRQEAERQLAAAGLSLEEWRRAVILGLKTRQSFEQVLLDAHFAADRQALLLAELDQAVSDAAAARARRLAPPSLLETGTSTVATLAGAARLGLLPAGDLQPALAAAGLDELAQEQELDLVTSEIADRRAADQVRDQVDAGAGEKELTLAQLATAVKRGLKSLEDYRARAAALGLTVDAADTLVRVLADELRDLNVARQAKQKVQSALETRGLSLGELEQRARDGAIALDGVAAQLADWGLGAGDVDLLVGLLAGELEV